MFRLLRVALTCVGVWLYWVVLIEPVVGFFTRLGAAMDAWLPRL